MKQPKKSSYRNPIAVAMNQRYRSQQTTHTSGPKGGQRNEQQELLEQHAQEVCQEEEPGEEG